MADDARPEDESLHDALDALARAMHDALELDTTPQARAANVAGRAVAAPSRRMFFGRSVARACSRVSARFAS